MKTFYEFVRLSPQDPTGKTPVDVWRTRLWSKALGPKLNCHSERAYALWKEERMKNMVFSKRVKAMLLALKKKYKLGLITNGPSDAQREKLDRVDASKYFETILISGDFGRPKPDPFLFKLAFKWLDVSAGECVMVGDKLETDIEGGINARVAANFLISPKDCILWDDMDLKPDFIIEHVCDIMNYFGINPEQAQAEFLSATAAVAAKDAGKLDCNYALAKSHSVSSKTREF